MPDTKLHYLATPYSRYPTGLEEAYRDAISQAVFLNEEGIDVFSPIAHSHHMTFVEVGSKDYYRMLKWDAKFIDRCDSVIVCMMEGWSESVGVNWEIDYAKSIGKPVYYMTPGELPNFAN